MRRLAPALLALALGACGSLDIGNGTLPCSSDGECPEGFECAADRNCWQPGTFPGLPPDLAQSLPDAGTDAAHPDLVTFDLAPIVVPPEAVWISGGGGSSVVPQTMNRLGLCIGGSSVIGEAKAVNGDSLTFGFLSSDTN